MFPTESEDSDQSISEDEDIDYKWSTSCVSLGSPADNKGNIGILSQLETLKDLHKLDCTSMVIPESPERRNELCIDDDVELPVFNNEHHFSVASSCNPDEEIGLFPVLEGICNSEEETVSDDEKLNVVSVKCETESILYEHTEAFYSNNEKSGCSLVCGISPKHIHPTNGRQGSVKHSHLFCYHREKEASHSVVGGDTFKSNISLSQIPLNVDLCTDPHMLGKSGLKDSLGNMQENEIELIGNDAAPSDIATEHKSSERSMAELLDCFQEKRSLQLGNSVKYYNINRTRITHFPRRNISPLGDRGADDDDIPSSDGEEIPQVLKAVVPETTIADQFHEALGSATRNDGIPHVLTTGKHCSGLFFNLQRVMLSEKERDLTFISHTLKGPGLSGEKICIDVRILSSSLEAKLFICHCTLKGEESSDGINHPNLKKTKGGSSLTVIFNPTICNDVELDKGNLIRIYPPWKEVNAKLNDEVVILSRYFSRIASDQINGMIMS
ncbi:unnamed protein product [Cuscuta epithymum]|uniref:Uncharacterized protein n=2 Tax=Cuscuta epithymum TaxID=186058 RepID=A0AAV0FEK4_9ASTE|nr:unnamed protein product [Cuscuta epithymum]CAH9133939.1 unnamed protein product [Cuscuta epithymum]